MVSYTMFMRPLCMFEKHHKNRSFVPVYVPNYHLVHPFHFIHDHFHVGDLFTVLKYFPFQGQLIRPRYILFFNLRSYNYTVEPCEHQSVLYT